MHGLGRDPRVGQRRLDLGIGLTDRFHERVNLRDQFRVQRFGWLASSGGEVLQAANPGAPFVQTGIHRFPSPTKDVFSLTRLAVTILNRHLGLKLPPPKSRQLARRRQDDFLHGFG